MRIMAPTYLCVFVLLLGLTWGGSALSTNDKSEPVAIVEDVRSAIESRVVAGWPAVDGQIPHQVSLRMVSDIGNVFSCGGSIIHHQWVITAAHCLANRYSVVVRAGLINVTRPQFITSSTLKRIHPGYNEVTAGVQTDDIALLGLEDHIPYGPFIQPCRLQSSQQKNDDYTGQILTVSGYGLTDDLSNGGTSSETLNWVHLRGIPNAQCQSIYGSLIQNPTICAEYYNNTAQSSCSGDSGGPLTVVGSDGRPTMVGVASFVAAAGCNSIFPSGYVRPGHYHDWYRQETGINFDWTDNRALPSAALSHDLYEEQQQESFINLNWN